MLLAVVPLLAGCGSDRPAADLPHPTDPGDVVLRFTNGSGMGTVQSFFTEPPVLVVTGDGTVYLRGEEVTTQGIVWPMFRFHADEPQVQALLHEADRDGLLSASPDYSPPAPIADGGDTVVEIRAAGGTWAHRANGLRGATQEDGARGRLADFVSFLDGWARTPRKPAAREIQPSALRVLARPSSSSPDEPVGRWPAATDVLLAQVGDCAVVTDPIVVHRLTTSDVHRYRQSGRTYDVAAAVLLPGDSCGSGSAS